MTRGSRMPLARTLSTKSRKSGSAGSTGRYSWSFSGDGQTSAVGRRRIGTSPFSPEQAVGMLLPPPVPVDADAEVFRPLPRRHGLGPDGALDALKEAVEHLAGVAQVRE